MAVLAKGAVWLLVPYVCHMRASASRANNMWVPAGSVSLKLQPLAGTAPY